MKNRLLLLFVLIATFGYAQNVSIPDANFKSYLVGNASINTNSDSEISVAEATAFTGLINIPNLSISDLTGIEAFTNITRLECHNNFISSLNLYSNTALTNLYCDGNSLTSLDLSANIALTSLSCNYNNLTSLNVKNGNNVNVTYYQSLNNPNLTCIEVDDAAYCTANWPDRSAAQSFSTNCTARVSSGTVYVNALATGNNDGSSWANAYTDLSIAINSTLGNSEIWVASGTYKPNAASRNVSFNIEVSDLKIYGGFAGTETAITQRVLGANEAILSGDLNDDDVNIADFISNYSNTTRNADNSYHIINITATGNNLLLDGLTISDAHTNLSATEKGGAILKEKTVDKLSIKNCIIKDNVSRNDNAGVYAEFELNNVGGTRGELNIENCQFINNMSRWATSVYSPIRNTTNVDITIANTVFNKNVTGNLNTTTAQGISGSTGWFRMLGSISDANLKFINNTVVNSLDDGTLESLNATSHATLAISKTSTGFTSTLNAEIANNIFWNNKTTGNVVARSITDLYREPVTSVNVYNSIDENNFTDSSITSTTNISNSDPLFTSATDFTLQSGSPAINTGDNVKIPSGITTDLSDNQRIFNTTVDMGAYEVVSSFSTSWTGASNTNWNVPTNWTNGVPTATINAIITNSNSGIVLIHSGTVSVKDLEIQGGGTLLIDGGLTIEGNLSMASSGIITVRSSATTNGSLIVKGALSGVSSKIQFFRHLTSDWHLISNPVNASIPLVNSNGYLVTNGNKLSLATYDNSLATNRYNYYTTASGTNNILNAGRFVAGKGYSMKSVFTGEIEFEADLNNADVPMVITDGSATGNKWNLVGNPFASSINANSNADATNNFLTVNVNELDPTRVAMYVWDASSGSYDIINQATIGSKYIAPGQGFFVESKNGGGSLQFTKAMQSHQTGNVFQKTSNNVPSIKLLVSNGSSQKSTDVKYFSNATIGLDPGYDAGVFSGEEAAFNVFTRLVSSNNTVDFGIQSLPTNNYDAMVIPVGVNAIANTILSFTIDAQNLPTDIHVYLEDKVENTFTLLDTDQASYKTTINDALHKDGRFYIHTTSSVLKVNNNNPTINSISIYKSSKRTLTVTGLENQEQNSVKIYTILGKEVFNTSIESQQKVTIKLPINLIKGVYLVKVQTVNGSLNKKIILN